MSDNRKLHASSIHEGDKAVRDQVILPNRVAFDICKRGIRTRLGRSMVTLLGVTLGITFLMAVVSGFQIKLDMREEGERMRRTDRRLAVLRSEVGTLAERKVVVFASGASDDDRRLLQALVDTYRAQVRIAGDLGGVTVTGAEAAQLPDDLSTEEGVAVVVGVGAYEGLPLLRSHLGAFKDRPFMVTRPPDAGFSARLKSEVLRVRPLDIDLRPDEIRDQQRRDAEARQRMLWVVAVSLLITVIGISNAMLMSVTERIREIGTMKCLGALSEFVVKLFLIESSLMGFVGSILGVLAGAVFSIVTYSYTFGFVGIVTSINYGVLLVYGLACVGAGVFLAIVAAIYPAHVAAKMVPAAALTSNV